MATKTALRAYDGRGGPKIAQELAKWTQDRPQRTPDKAMLTPREAKPWPIWHGGFEYRWPKQGKPFCFGHLLSGPSEATRSVAKLGIASSSYSTPTPLPFIVRVSGGQRQGAHGLGRGTWNLRERFAKIWDAVSFDLDGAPTKVWLEPANGKQSNRSVFITANRFAPSSFIDTKLALEIDANPHQKGTIGKEKLLTILSSRIGNAMFKDEALEFQFAEFLASACGRLKDAEHDGYTKDVTDGFKQSMLQDVKFLRDSGHSLWRKKSKELCSYLSVQCEVDYVSLNDFWAFPMEARIRSLGVSSNKVWRTPWEQVLYGAQEPLPGFANHVVIEEQILVDCANTRRAIEDVFQGLLHRTYFR